jgi:tungstate transport system ATP-binding protein
MGAQVLIAFHNLRKTIAGRCLFDIPQLVIEQGRCMFLSGENGTGKTTLLKIIAGLEAPDHAEVHYRDKILPWKKARRLCRGQAVYLHQTPYLFDASVADNVAYGLHRSGVPRAEARRHVAEALRWAGLEHLSERNARQLSGGERQRVALARARILSPRLLLLDEPTASMDYEARERTYFLIQRLRSEDMAVLIASHELERLMPLGDVHLHLHHGELRERADYTAAARGEASAAMRRVGNEALRS